MQRSTVTPFSLFAIRPEPWRNGGGTTRVIATEPEGAEGNGFTYRLSIADISRDGAFSTFDGVERTSLLLEGRELKLHHEGRLLQTGRLLQAIRYDGGLPLDAHIGDEPARCLNVMTRKALAEANLKVIDASSFIDATELCMVLSLHDGCTVTSDGSPSKHELNRYEGLLLRQTKCVVSPALGRACRQVVVVSISQHAR